MIETAVQQIMLGTVLKNEKQAEETLRLIRDAGYDGIELNGFMIRPTGMLVRLLTKFAGMPTGACGKPAVRERGRTNCSARCTGCFGA